ncbi:MAG: lysoplasmalogenase family protein [Candidatus Heimdallarchaeota archaeon]
MKHAYMLVYLIATLVFLITIIRFVSYGITFNPLPELFLGASLLISTAAIIIRVFIVDLETFSASLLQTAALDSPKTLNPSRFFNVMPIAMIVCTIADFLIRKDFAIGMLTFLAAQTLYLSAYSGIIPLLNLKTLFSGKTQLLTVTVTLGWAFITTIIYVFLLFNPEEVLTLAILPYVIVLCLMVIITYLLLIRYPDRPLKFRIMLAGGGTSFFISDAILGINRFTTPIPVADLWIHPSYLLAVFLLQYSVLFVRSTPEKSIYINH